MLYNADVQARAFASCTLNLISTQLELRRSHPGETAVHSGALHTVQHVLCRKVSFELGENNICGERFAKKRPRIKINWNGN
jgi:hypothetical protein